MKPKLYVYLARKWSPLADVLKAWDGLTTDLRGIKITDPSKIKVYEEFNGIKPPPAVPQEHKFLCAGVDLRGLSSEETFFLNLEKMLSYGPEFGGAGHSISYLVAVNYNEKAIEQDRQFCNTLSIWFQNGQVFLSIDFGERTRFNSISQIQSLFAEVRGKTKIKIENYNGPSINYFKIPIEATVSLSDLAEGYMCILELIGYSNIFESRWNLVCVYPDDAQTYGVKYYNHAIELQIPAERHSLELQATYKTWDMVEELRSFCGPDDVSAKPLGLLRVQKRTKLEFRFFTCAEGYQLALITDRPLEGPEGANLTPEMMIVLERAGLDLKRGMAYEKIFGDGEIYKSVLT